MKKVVFGALFVKRDMRFDASRDLQEVDQFGFVNLASAYERGVLPGSVELTSEDFNGCVNPGTLISRSQDIFDGLRKREYVAAVLSKLSAAEREKVENAMNRQASREAAVEVNVSPEG